MCVLSERAQMAKARLIRIGSVRCHKIELSRTTTAELYKHGSNADTRGSPAHLVCLDLRNFDAERGLTASLRCASRRDSAGRFAIDLGFIGKE